MPESPTTTPDGAVVAAPVDAAARARIASDLDTTLFVEAGAGTGKTTALVARIRGLVASGAVELRHVAAITFTEAAAAQLRDRVRAALEQAVGDPSLSEQERSRCAEAVHQVDEAAMLTLHGFAQHLLAEHPLEARLPPAFEVLDELAEAESFDHAWRALRDELLDDRTLAEPVETLFCLGLTLYGLEGLARGLAADYDRLDDPGALPVAPDDDGAVARWAEGLRGLAECLAWCRHDDALAAHLRDVVALGERVGAEAPRERLRLVAGARITSRSGRAADWDGRAEGVRERLRDLEAARTALLEAEGARALAPVLDRMRAWALTYAERRRREGRVTFHDLLVLARDLLRDRPDVRHRAAQRWRRLLIDEFQDTDPLQIEIAAALADAAPETGGALFFVGDPKQSIYRFRRADIAVYHEVRDRHAAALLQLSAGFRTVPAVLACVNALFSSLLDGAPGQAPFHPLHPVREPLPLPPDGLAPVRLVGGPDGAADAAGLRATEASDVAEAVRAIRDECWPVWDERQGAVRPARFDDIAILLPTRTGLPDLERALERAGVPYRVEASSLVYGTQEVRELIALLRAVDDPTDEVAVIAALRGPALACPDDALAAWAAARGGWDYRRPTSGANRDEPDREEHDRDEDDGHGHDGGDAAIKGRALVAEALATLRRFHDLRRRVDAAELLDVMVRELDLFPLALGRGRARDAWRRLRFVLDEARAFAEGGGTPRELIRRLERQADDRVRVTEQVLPDEDDDAVRILTVHAAKGLEFGVVILAGLGVRPQTGGGMPLVWDADGVAQVRCGTVQTPGYGTAKARETALEEQERVRLLYVAATRARDHLILSLHHRPAVSGAPTSAEILWRRLEAGLQGGAELAASWRPPRAAPVAATDTVDTPAGDIDPAAWRAARARAERGWATAPIVSATALGRDTSQADDGSDGADDADQATRPPFRRGRAGTALGRAVHAALQTVALDGSDPIGPVATAQAAAEGMPERADEVARMISAALRSEPVREAVASGRWWREVPVSAAIGEGLLEGFVDLLYEGDDGALVLVDYKTDRAVEHAPARYRQQLGAYALAIECALGRPVARAALVFAAEGSAAVHWVDDLRDAAAQARDAVERRLATPAG